MRPTCEQIIKRANCPEPAAFTFLWPGQPRRSIICSLHVGLVVNAAMALGFTLETPEFDSAQWESEEILAGDEQVTPASLSALGEIFRGDYLSDAQISWPKLAKHGR